MGFLQWPRGGCGNPPRRAGVRDPAVDLVGVKTLRRLTRHALALHGCQDFVEAAARY